MIPKICNIFNECQVTSASHQTLTLVLYGIYKKVDYNEFRDIIILIITKILLIDNGTVNKDVQKAIQFLTSFLVYMKLKESDEECILLKDVLDYFLKTHCSIKHVVRFRTCEIISNLLKKFKEHSIDSFELLDEIQNALLERLLDPKADVRLQALNASETLQNPNDPQDPVLKHYMNKALYDTSPKVRKLAVEKIAIRKDVMAHIVSRTRDVDVYVRLASFTKLSNLVKALKIAERQTVLIAGSMEKDDKVLHYVANKMIVSWFEQYDYDVLKTINALRLDADEKDIANTVESAEFFLNCLFKTLNLMDTLQAVPVDDNAKIPYDQLNWDTVLLWTVLTQYLRQNQFDDVLDKILPDLVNFCDYILEYCKWQQESETQRDSLEAQFILQQLLTIASNYDISDVVTRNTLIKSTRTLLETANLNVEAINIAMKILEKCIPNTETRCKFVTEITSEIMYTTNDKIIQPQEDLVELKNRYLSVTAEMISSKNAEDYLKAAKYQEELNKIKILIENKENTLNQQSEIERKTDCNIIQKYLNIAIALLNSPKITVLTPTLMTLKEDIVQEYLIHPDPNIKAQALKVYVLCCLLDEDNAKTGIHICAIPIIDYHENEPCELPLLTVAIGGVVDMLLLFGDDLLEGPDQENVSDSNSEQHRATFTGGTSLTSIIQGLVELMDDENLDISVLAVKGLCLLVSDGGLESPSVISRLILKWAHPETESAEEIQIKARIGNTLIRLVRNSAGTQQLKKAILLTIRTLIQVPKNSPLYTVQRDVIKFLIALCSTSIDYLGIQTELAVSICNLIRSDPTSTFNIAYTEALLLLELPDTDECLINDLLDDCYAILDDLTNKQVANKINKFVAKLQKIVPPLNRVRQGDESNSEESESSMESESEFIDKSQKHTSKPEEIEDESEDDSEGSEELANGENELAEKPEKTVTSIISDKEN